MTNDVTPQDYADLAFQIASQFLEEPKRLKIRVAFRRSRDRRFERQVLVSMPGEHSKADHGRLIGAKGKHYRALLRILQSYGAQFSHQVDLEVLDPGGVYQIGEPRPEDSNWNRDELFRAMLESIVGRVLGFPVPVRVWSDNNKTHLVIESHDLSPELLSSFELLWKAIGRHHGREFSLTARLLVDKAV